MSVPAPLSVRWLGPSLIEKGIATRVEVDVERDGAACTVSGSPTMAVYDSDGETISAALAVSVEGTTLYATVPADDTDEADYSGAWLVKVSATIDGRAEQLWNVAALVRTRVHPPAGTSDLTARLRKLADLQTGGTADLQRFLTQAWARLLQALYDDDCPFWRVRSLAAAREWLIACAAMLALDEAGMALPPANPYTTAARRLEASLEGLYTALRLRIDSSEAATVGEESIPARRKSSGGG